MSTFATRIRLGSYAVLGAVALSLASAVPAHAGTSISIGGNTNWGIVTKAITSRDSAPRGTRVSGTADIKYTARVLGLPLPVTGYYVNSFPTTFQQPRVDSYDAHLSSTTYKQVYDSWQHSTQWMVSGSESFWGGKHVTVKGSAVAGRVGSKFFHAGTGSGHQADTNASRRISIS
ncbi:hypothetical protein JT358_00805 [Micrococcales bacterium 31B]|nr:hypothetical protein [Micrococcales bacterium 31B]